MTDLVQKIEAAVHEWFGERMDDGAATELREAIRQALADAGGAVAWFRFAGDGFIRNDEGYAIGTDEPSIEYGAMPKGHGWQPLYTHPDSGRVAELEREITNERELFKTVSEVLTEVIADRDRLEAQLTASREREDALHTAIAMLNLPYEQAKALLDKTLAADKEKNDE